MKKNTLYFYYIIYSIILFTLSNVSLQAQTVEYCDARGLSSNTTWIDYLRLGDIDTLSGNNQTGYVDLTHLSTDLYAGNAYTMIMTPGVSSGDIINSKRYWRAWIDFDQDGLFESSEMIYDTGSLFGEPNQIVANFQVPYNNVMPGTTRMRVAIAWVDEFSANPPEACGTFDLGEVEDYSVNIIREDFVREYCEAYAENATTEWIDSIMVGRFTNLSGKDEGYGDYTNQTIEGEAGQRYDFRLAPAYKNAAEAVHWKMWIDFNQNLIFDQADLVYDSEAAITGVVEDFFFIPTTAKEGETRMRVVMKRPGVNPDNSVEDRTPPEECGTFQLGEVEDYTFKITPLQNNRPPLADFEANPISGQAPLSVQFSDISQNVPTSWQWSFEGANETSSKERNPRVNYNSEGLYGVTLTVGNAIGSNTETKEQYIEVLASPENPPEAEFSVNQRSGIAPLTVQFINQSTFNPDSSFWTFEGGDPSTSNKTNPSVTYEEPGLYDVSLRVFNEFGDDTDIETQYIRVEAPEYAPVADFRASPTTGRAPLKVLFTDQSTNNPTNWQWSFVGADNAAGDGPIEEITYSNPGIYNVRLTVRNSAGKGIITKDSLITVLGPDSTTPVADFDADVYSGFPPLRVQFINQSTQFEGEKYKWYFGEEASPKESAAFATSVSYKNPGTYKVALVAYNDQGRDSTCREKFITVFPPKIKPTANFEANQTDISIGEQIQFTDLSENYPETWSWTFEGGTPTTVEHDTIPVVTYSTTGVYDVQLKVGNSWGEDSITFENYITVTDPNAPPIPAFEASVREGYAPLKVTFTNQSVNFDPDEDTWEWNLPGSNIPTPKSLEPVVTYQTPGVYDAQLTINETQLHIEEGYINVLAEPKAPIANFEADVTKGTVPLTVTFTDLSENLPTTRNWDFGEADPPGATSTNPTVTYNKVGTYTVSLTVANELGSDVLTKEAYIIVEEAAGVPVVDFIATPTSGLAPLTVDFEDLSTNKPTKHNWNFEGSSSPFRTAANPKGITYEEPGEYTVTLTAENAQGSATKTKEAYIKVNSSAIPPVADFKADITSGIERLTVQFEDLSLNNPYQWEWTFEGGDTTSSDKQNPTVVYDEVGQFDVCLTSINDAGRSAPKCIEDYIIIRAGSEAPVPDFTANPRSGPAPLTVYFENITQKGAAVLVWTFEGVDTTQIEDPTPIITYYKPGTYDVTLEARNLAGSTDTTKEDFITVLPPIQPPIANFTASPTSGHFPLEVTFQNQSENNPSEFSWIFEGGTPTTSDEENPTITYKEAGTYSVSLVVSNPDGSDTKTKNGFIIVSTPTFAPVANFEGNVRSGYAPLTVQFTDLSINEPAEWRWKFEGIDPITSNEQNPTVTYSQKGNYTVTLDVSNIAGSAQKKSTGYITINSSVGMDLEEKINGYISIFPNPASDWLRVAFDLANPVPINYAFYNPLGQLLLQESLGTHTKISESIELKHLPAGLYLLELEVDGVKGTYEIVKE